MLGIIAQLLANLLLQKSMEQVELLGLLLPAVYGSSAMSRGASVPCQVLYKVVDSL
jgi:hypothetical protein